MQTDRAFPSWLIWSVALDSVRPSKPRDSRKLSTLKRFTMNLPQLECTGHSGKKSKPKCGLTSTGCSCLTPRRSMTRSEEHTSELQSRLHLVCRLLLEKKKKHNKTRTASAQHPPHLCRSPHATTTH